MIETYIFCQYVCVFPDDLYNSSLKFFLLHHSLRVAQHFRCFCRRVMYIPTYIGQHHHINLLTVLPLCLSVCCAPHLLQALSRVSNSHTPKSKHQAIRTFTLHSKFGNITLLEGYVVHWTKAFLFAQIHREKIADCQSDTCLNRSVFINYSLYIDLSVYFSCWNCPGNYFAISKQLFNSLS